jgi:RNA polymerase sigma-70 factor (ECF subfamily)
MRPAVRKQRIAEWARRWNAGLTRFLRSRVSNQIDAEDLAQEVYVRLLRIESLELIEEPQAYVYRMASNVASEWRLRASQRKPHSSEELDMLVATTDPEAHLDDEALSQLLDDSLKGMSPMIRAVTYLKIQQGLSHDEIAQQLGITTRMVRRFLGQGYLHLRETVLIDRVD